MGCCTNSVWVLLPIIDKISRRLRKFLADYADCADEEEEFLADLADYADEEFPAR